MKLANRIFVLGYGAIGQISEGGELRRIIGCFASRNEGEKRKPRNFRTCSAERPGFIMAKTEGPWSSEATIAALII